MNSNSAIGGDAAAMEFQQQAAVEIDPQGATVRCTRWVFRECVSRLPKKR